jgi:hypothetical protein
MYKEAFLKIVVVFGRSKILLPGLLLFLAWIITIFTFYIYQTPKTSVEGIAMKKFSNLSPSPVTTPTPTVVVYKNSRATISEAVTVTVTPQANINSVTTSQSNVSSGNSSSGSNNFNPTPSQIVTVTLLPTITIAPTPVNIAGNSATLPTTAHADYGNGAESSNCVKNTKGMIICQSFFPQVAPAVSSFGGTTISTGNSTNLNGVSGVGQFKPNN